MTPNLPVHASIVSRNFGAEVWAVILSEAKDLCS